MNTKLLLAASAVGLGGLGLAASFLPQEILAALGSTASGLLPVVVQLLGAMLIGWAMMNWMAKDSLIGGIYNRPIALGNLVHFAVGALALLKAITAGNHALPVLLGGVIYAIFAVGFGLVVFGSAVKAPAAGA